MDTSSTSTSSTRILHTSIVDINTSGRKTIFGISTSSIGIPGINILNISISNLRISDISNLGISSYS